MAKTTTKKNAKSARNPKMIEETNPGGFDPASIASENESNWITPDESTEEHADQLPPFSNDEKEIKGTGDPPMQVLSVCIDGDPAVHPGYCNPRLDTHMKPRQAAAAKFLATMLSAQGARVASGRASVDPTGVTVETSNDAVRWLLDQFADQIESATGKTLINDFELSFR